MNTHRLMASSISQSSIDGRRVTRRMLRERAFELALMSGHAPQEASAPEWEQAKRDLLNPSAELPAKIGLNEADDSMFDHMNLEPAPLS